MGKFRGSYFWKEVFNLYANKKISNISEYCRCNNISRTVFYNRKKLFDSNNPSSAFMHNISRKPRLYNEDIVYFVKQLLAASECSVRIIINTKLVSFVKKNHSKYRIINPNYLLINGKMSISERIDIDNCYRIQQEPEGWLHETYKLSDDALKILFEESQTKTYYSIRTIKNIINRSFAKCILSSKVFPKYNSYKPILKLIFDDINANILVLKDTISLKEIKSMLPSNVYKEILSVINKPIKVSKTTVANIIKKIHSEKYF